MTSKDSMKKDELIAALNEAEGREDQLKKDLDAANTRAADAQAELEKAKQRQTTTAPAKASTPASGSPKDKPGASPDGRTHYISRFTRYKAGDVLFENNRFATDDPAVIDRLASHPACGNEFWVSLVPVKNAA